VSNFQKSRGGKWALAKWSKGNKRLRKKKLKKELADFKLKLTKRFCRSENRG